MHEEKGSGTALGLDALFRDGLHFSFLLALYFTILFLYTNDFNPRINKNMLYIPFMPS